MTPAIQTDTNSPEYRSPAFRAMAPYWTFVRRIRAINSSLRSEAEDILPRAEEEGRQNYAARVAMTVGFNALDETIHGLVGLAMRHDPVLEKDVPDPVRAMWEDVDLLGNHGDVFTQQVLELALQDGHCGVLTDYPPVEKELTLAEERARGLRPYLVLVPVDRITAWRPGRILGRFCPMMLKLLEAKEDPDGAFGTKTVARYRTFYQEVTEAGEPFVRFVVHEEAQTDGGKTTWTEVERGQLRGPQWIPFRVAYGGERTGLLTSRPPLLGLAWTNLEHTMVTSQHAWSLYKTGIAIPVARGRHNPESPLKLSSDEVIDVSEGGGFEFAQGAGTALQPAADKLVTLERRMGSQGYSMMRREAQAQQTATEKELQSRREESKLARAVRSVNDTMEGALQDIAAFLKLESGGSISMDRNFSDVSLSPDEMRVLNELEDAGKLTHLTLLKQLQAGGRLLQGVDVEQEVVAAATQRELTLIGPGDAP